MKLHIISRSAGSHSDISAASRIASGALLLIEDGVLSAVNGSPARELLQRLMDEGVREIGRASCRERVCNGV